MKKTILTTVIFLSVLFNGIAQESEVTTTYSDALQTLQDRIYQRHKTRDVEGQTGLKSIAEETHRLDSVIEFNFNDISEKWEKQFEKDAYYYDAANNETLFVFSAWDSNTEDWSALYKEESAYDNAGNLASYASYNFGATNNKWTPFYKGTYIYNDNNMVTESTLYSWKYNLEDWLAVENKVFVYDNENNLTSDTTYWFDSEGQVKSYFQKTEYVYKDGKLERKTIWNWSSKNMEWENYQYFDYLYLLIQGVLTKKTQYTYYTIEQSWVNDKKTFYGYLEDKYRIEQVTQSRNKDNTWEEMYKEGYEYNTTITSDALILPYSISGYNDAEFFHHKVLSKELSSKEDVEGSDEKKYREVIYYYSSSGETSSTASQLGETIAVYPNPAHAYLNVDLPQQYQNASIEIISANGSRVMHSTVSNKQPLYIESLVPGMYVYRIILGQEIISGKFVKN